MWGQRRVDESGPHQHDRPKGNLSITAQDLHITQEDVCQVRPSQSVPIEKKPHIFTHIVAYFETTNSILVLQDIFV